MTTVSIRSVVPSIAASIAWSSRRNLGTGRGRSIDGTSQTAAWRWWSERTTGARSSGEAVFEREGGRGGSCCAQLELRSFGIARVPHGDAEEHLGPRALVRELEFAPGGAGAPEILERLLRTAIGKTNGTPCRRRGRLERRRADLAGDHG